MVASMLYHCIVNETQRDTMPREKLYTEDRRPLHVLMPTKTINKAKREARKRRQSLTQYVYDAVVAHIDRGESN